MGTSTHAQHHRNDYTVLKEIVETGKGTHNQLLVDRPRIDAGLTSTSSGRSRLWLAIRRRRSATGAGCGCSSFSLAVAAPLATVAWPRPRPRMLPRLFAEPIESRPVLVLLESASRPASCSSYSRSVSMLRMEPLLGPRVCAARTCEGPRESWDALPLKIRRSSVMQSCTSSGRSRYAASSRRARRASRRAGLPACS
jgi:hypothetical protein